MKAVKRLRALRVDVGEVMMGVKKIVGGKENMEEKFFFAGGCIEFCTRGPRSQGPKFWRKVFGKLFMTIIYRHTFALKST